VKVRKLTVTVFAQAGADAEAMTEALFRAAAGSDNFDTLFTFSDAPATADEERDFLDYYEGDQP
jgi:hypothetical protein